jgi:glycosyltransferase involved in cell wall biosynthesis
MKILVISSTFPGGDLDGSRPRFVYDLAEALAGHPDVGDVVAVAPHHAGAPTRERMGSVEVVRFRYWWPSHAERLTPNMRQQIRGSLLARIQIPFFLLAELWTLWRMVRRRDVDVVNAHWMIPQGLIAALVKGTPGADFVLAVHLHAGDVYQLAKMPFGRTITRFIVRRSDRIFADGSHVRSTLDSLLGHDSGALIQPMGFDRDLFGEHPLEEPEEARAYPQGFILFVGRLVEKKGAVYLIRALPRVLDAYPRLGLVVVGSGPEEDALREEARALGLGDSVRFLGHRSHAEIAAFLRHCRVAAVPSIVDRHGETEGMPTVLAEAMAAGVRTVGSAVDGIPDLVCHGENGWLCREKDHDDLADKLLLALADGAESTVVDAAMRTAGRLEWGEIAKDYVRTLRG